MKRTTATGLSRRLGLKEFCKVLDRVATDEIGIDEGFEPLYSTYAYILFPSLGGDSGSTPAGRAHGNGDMHES